MSCIVITEYRRTGAVSDRPFRRSPGAAIPQTVCRVRDRADAATKPANHHPLQPRKCSAVIGTADALAGFLLTIFLSGRTQMLTKYMTAGLVGSALLATVAVAPTPTATTDSANPSATASDSALSSLQCSAWRGSTMG